MQASKLLQQYMEEEEVDSHKVNCGGEAKINSIIGHFRYRCAGKWIRCILHWCTCCCCWVQFVCSYLDDIESFKGHHAILY